MRVNRTVGVANGLAAVGAMAFSVAALVDPALALPTGSEVTTGVDFYAQLYAARALPLGAAVLFALLSGSKRGLVPLLVVAGLVQAGDCVIGLAQHLPGPVVGGSVLAAIHLGSAWYLTRQQRLTAAVA
jgi:hypothetical protein